MSFSKRTNCKHCGYPLHLQDVKNIYFENDDQCFLFECSSCEKDNLIKVPLIKNGHLTSACVGILKENKDIVLPNLVYIRDHVNTCDTCKSKVNDIYLNEVEDQIRFNQKSFDYFIKNSKEILKNLEMYEIEEDFISSFEFEGKKYSIKKEDEFYSSEQNEYKKKCYYLRDKTCLLGMVSFLIFKNNILIDRLYLRPDSILKKEHQFFKDLKDGKVNLKLETFQKIFKIMKNELNN